MHIEFSDNYPDHHRAMEIVQAWREGQESFSIYSSGSTGEPKEIQLPRRLLRWSCLSTAEQLGLKNERCLVVLPIERTGGFMQLIRAAEMEWTLRVHVPSSDPLAEVDRDHNYTLCSMSPLQLHYSLENSPKKLSRFKTILIGGAAVDPELEKIALAALKDSDLQLVETFGMTETASHIALRPFGQAQFQPSPGVELEALEHGLRIRIPEIGWEVMSTDRIALDAYGFRPIGRSDLVINSGGIKIHPELEEKHIKQLLSDMGIMRSFYLSSKEDPILGESLVLVLEPPELKDQDYVLEYLRRNCRKHYAPSQLIFSPINYSSTGKIERRKF